MGKGGRKVSHLCFAENKLLFAESNAKQTEAVMKCLDISLVLHLVAGEHC